MTKRSLVKTALPPELNRALRDLGDGLKVARRRRRQSQTEFAQRLMVSRATVQRMEQGDPSVALGSWVTAAWLLGRLSDLHAVFDPDRDEMGKRLERRYLPRRAGKSRSLNAGLDNDF